MEKKYGSEEGISRRDFLRGFAAAGLTLVLPIGCAGVDGLILCDYTPEERCETLSWSEKDCCLSSLEDAREKGWKILPADCCIDEESGNEMCADFDCYSVFGEPEIGTKWDVVKPKCEGGLAFCVPGSWNVAES